MQHIVQLALMGWQCLRLYPCREVTAPERVQHLVGGTVDSKSGATMGENVSLGQRISLSASCLVRLLDHQLTAAARGSSPAFSKIIRMLSVAFTMLKSQPDLMWHRP